VAGQIREYFILMTIGQHASSLSQFALKLVDFER
jgi:hypothetical protein